MAERTSSSRRPKPSDDSVGNFIVDQEIGKGSFAQVYSGRHKVRRDCFSSTPHPSYRIYHPSSLPLPDQHYPACCLPLLPCC